MLRRGHALGGQAGAQCLEFAQGFEHGDELGLIGPRHHRAAMRSRIDEPAGPEQTDGLAYRRARDVEAPRQLHLVEGDARGQFAAHDVVRDLHAQALGKRLGGSLHRLAPALAVRQRNPLIDAPAWLRQSSRP